MTMAYEISGIPWLAMRAGRALERWGARSARPVSHDEARERHARQLVYEAAVEARRSSLIGMYPYVR
jgi:hypothetical protein